MMKKLWNDDAGIVALEYLLVATLIGLATIVGLNSVGTALNIELVELSSAITNVSQQYSYHGHSGCNTSVDGGATTDADYVFPYSTTVQGPTTITEVCP